MDHGCNGAYPVEPVKGVQRLGTVGHADGDPVALAYAVGSESFGSVLDLFHEITETGLYVKELIGRFVGIFF